MRLVQIQGAAKRGVLLDAFAPLPRFGEQGGDALAQSGELLYLAFRKPTVNQLR